MLMHEAMNIINRKKTPSDKIRQGFMVNFERRTGAGLRVADSFPDKYAGDPLIKTEEEAWELARKFANETVCRCVNIYVIDQDFNPVPGYEAHKIDNR
ncbi:MAG: hypothetical protein ACXW0T_12110 [Methylobacter sp.]